MILKFCPKDDQMVAVPGTAQYAGQVARFVGREWSESIHGFPAASEPYECDSETDECRRLLKIARRDGALLPADQATADAIGVPFAPLKFKGGAWFAAPQTTSKKGDS